MSYIKKTQIDWIVPSSDSTADFTALVSSQVSFPDGIVYAGDRSSIRRLLIGRRKEVCGGDPIIVGSRISVASVIEKLRILDGDIQRVIQSYPHITQEQVEACKEYYEEYSREIDRIINLEKRSR